MKVSFITSIFLGASASLLFADHKYHFHNFTNTDTIHLKGLSHNVGSLDERFKISIRNGETEAIENMPWWQGISRFVVEDEQGNRLCEVDQTHLPSFQSGKGIAAGIPLEGRFGSHDIFILPKNPKNRSDKRCIVKIYPAQENTIGIRTCIAHDAKGKELGSYRVFTTDFPGSCNCNEEGNPYETCIDSRNIEWETTGSKIVDNLVKYGSKFLREYLKRDMPRDDASSLNKTKTEQLYPAIEYNDDKQSSSPSAQEVDDMEVIYLPSPIKEPQIEEVD